MPPAYCKCGEFGLLQSGPEVCHGTRTSVPLSLQIVYRVRHPADCGTGMFWFIRRSRACRHLPAFYCNIFRCAPCVSVPLPANGSKPCLSAYQQLQRALTGRDCLLRAGPFTFRSAMLRFRLRHPRSAASPGLLRSLIPAGRRPAAPAGGLPYCASDNTGRNNGGV